MLYAVTYELVGISGQGGSIYTVREDMVDSAKSTAEIALDLLGDYVVFSEWLDLEGGEVEDPRTILLSKDTEEVINIIQQVSDQMQSQRDGYICLWEYADLFELIKEHNVESWCSESIKGDISRIRKDYFALVEKLSDEWSSY